MLANKQCIMIEGHWFNNSKNFSLLKNLEDTKLRIFFHNPDLIMGSGLTRPLMGTHPTRASGLMALTAHQFPSIPAMTWTRISVTPLAPAHCLNRGMLNSPLLLRVIQLPGLIQMALVLCIQAMNSGLPYLAAMPSPPPMDEVRRLNNSTLPARGSPKHHLNLPPTPLSQHLWIDNLTTWISTQHSLHANSMLITDCCAKLTSAN